MKYVVAFDLNPTRLVMRGVMSDDTADFLPPGMKAGRVEVVTKEQYGAIGESDEPSKVVAEMFSLPYAKRARLVGRPLNIVELVGDPSFNQSCRFGSLVEGHAVYCHNDWWVDAPRKCRRTWYTGGEIRDEDCPGFEPRETEGDW
jgi:hypothetical protein